MLRMTYFRILAASLPMLHACATWAVEQKVGFEIGIAPFLPVKTLVQNYAPLRDYLQNRLNVPVTIVSAPDYKTYYKCIQKHDYPIIIAAANSAYLAWSESAYIPLLKPLVYTRPVVVISKDKTLNKLTELRGKSVAMSDVLAIVSMQGLQMLREAGLEPERDVTVKNMLNQGVAINFVISGEVAAAIVSDRAILQMPLAIREQIKIVYTWDKGAAPGIVYLARPDMPGEQIKQISRAIQEFARDVPEGKELMKRWGYDGLVPITAEELQRLAPYGILLKEEISKIH